MSTDDSFIPPKKKPSILWWLGGVFLLLVCLFLYQLFGPNPRIVVSPQTTYVTAPLADNGLPDYEAYYREAFRAGVTPDNNAAPLLFEALGPGDLNPQDAEALAREFGLSEVPTNETSLRPLYAAQNRKRIAAWLHEQGRLKLPGQVVVSDKVIQEVLSIATRTMSDEAERLLWDVVDGEIDRASSRPWTSDQIPPLAKWISENQQHLDLIVAASKRPRYYSPPPCVLHDDQDLLMSMALPQIQASRDAARALRARAMWHLGEGRPNDAWRDLLAIHRLAGLLTEDGTIVGQLVAYAISNMACDSTLTLLDHRKHTADQARQVQRDLASIPSFSTARAFDKGERLFALDALVCFGSEGSVVASLAEDEFTSTRAMPGLDAVSVDWNIVLRDFNACYDQLAAAAALPDRAQRLVAMANVETSIQQMEENLRSPSNYVAAAFSQQRRSKLLSGLMSSYLIPAVTAVSNSQDRTNATLELTRIAAALAVYRAEHGAYPEKLRELVPAAITKLPSDPYMGKPFIYVRIDPGYLLYSLGENSTDDSGNNESMSIFEGISLEESTMPNPPPQIPTGSDDISIRVPRPPLKLPKTPPAEVAQ
jgi:hypothetical protein